MEIIVPSEVASWVERLRGKIVVDEEPERLVDEETKKVFYKYKLLTEYELEEKIKEKLKSVI
jgi:hypothetical protein